MSTDGRFEDSQQERDSPLAETKRQSQANSLAGGAAASNLSQRQVKYHQKPNWITHPYPRAPLVESIQFSLESSMQPFALEEAVCVVSISTEATAWEVTHPLKNLTFEIINDGERRIMTYRLDLFGLQPQTQYKATVDLQFPQQKHLLDPCVVLFKTQHVSPLFPQIQVNLADHARMEPGLTLFNLIRWENNKPDSKFGAIVAIDHSGTLRWIYQAEHLIFVVRKLSNGNLLYGYGNRTDGLIEINLRGEIVRRWDAANLDRTVADGAIPVAVDALHHDLFPLNDETFFALSTSLHEMPSYYAPDYHPRKRIEGAHLIADDIIELQTDGTIVNRYSLFELLDPHRIGYGSLHNFWDSRGYENVPGGTYDWSHANSVAYDVRSDSLIVSVRHQDAIISIDRQRGGLNWILGNPKGWRGEWSKKLLKPTGGSDRQNLTWSYHQHDVTLTPHGTLLLFDNGNYQAVPFDKQLPAAQNSSRVVEYRVDQEQMTVEQVWEYRGVKGQEFYSTFLSGAAWLPRSGNVLVTNGGEIRDAMGERTDYAPGATQWAEIFEVTYSTPPERLFEVRINAPPAQPNIGWSIYRSSRLDNLFETR